jgi:8-oxo-dGTP diphosphatase
MGQMRGIYVAVKALIIRDGKILIIKRSSKEDVYKNEWDLPGGKLKFGENPIDGLKREVFEETGLKFKIIKPISVWTFFKNDRKTQVIGITFLAKPISDEIKLSKEHVDSKWVLPEEIDNYQIHEEIKKLIRSLVSLV